MPIDFLAACVATLAALQGLSMLLTNLEIAAKQIEGRSTWIAPNGTVFEEFAVTELGNSQVMQREFAESHPEVSLTTPLAAHANG